MDLLPSPTGKSILGDAPFAGESLRWDGGSFLHFACRRGWLANVPLHLRHCKCPEPYRDRRRFKPLNKDEKESFMQTWLFFGLLAEFYGLNAEPTDDSELAQATHSEVVAADPIREAAIESLYALFHKPAPEADGSGLGSKVHVIGTPLDDENKGKKMVEHLLTKVDRDTGSAKLSNYTSYLSKCLEFTGSFVNYLNTSIIEFEPSIAISISALGELCESTLRMFVQQYNIRSAGTALTWGEHYLRAEGEVEKDMLKRGWCRSDIERMRHSFFGLASRHFLSHLEKPISHSHRSCTVQMCTAAQIDPRTYVLKHVKSCGGCGTIGVDQEEVKRVLRDRHSESFPVLRLDRSREGDGRVTHIRTEKHTEDKPYVALSHVWADGLGNPGENALQSCQIDRLARLIQAIPRQPSPDQPTDRAEGQTKEQYWFWIDTLCCPVSVEEKKIALERIASVYQKAAHVLVLDESISSFTSEGEGPGKAAENCLRIFGTASWMRRLWTLQEGALARSLYFQFSDRAISWAHEAKRLLEFAKKDLRYLPISKDVAMIVYRFGVLCSPTAESTSQTPNSPELQPQESTRYLNQVSVAQECLFFRNVSIESDEPLCLATLLSLKPTLLLDVKICRQQRMAALWKLLAQKTDSTFPTRVIFYNDQPLGLTELDGWRWAPKSLLPRPEHGLSYDMAICRLSRSRNQKMGIITTRGLQLSSPGMHIALHPWGQHPSRRVWPWSVITRKRVEHLLFCRNESGGWFSLVNQIRGEHINSWTWDEWTRQDSLLLEEDAKMPVEGQRPSQPIFNELHQGKLVLIRDMESLGPGALYLLARIQETPVNNERLYVHACLPVYMSEMDSSLWPGLDLMQKMAAQVYASDINQELLRFIAQQEGGRDPDPEGEEYKRIVADLREEMQRVAAEGREADKAAGHLARASNEFVGDTWKTMPLIVPFDISTQSLPDDQVWVVDRPVVGDGLCHDQCCTKSL